MFALVAHVIAQSTTTNSITSSAIDTTGADLLVAVTNHYIGGGGSLTLSDSKGNTWTPLTLRSVGSGRSRMYYAKNAIVGTGHTFTATGTGSFPVVAVQAFSGSDLTSPFDVENGVSDTSIFLTSGQPGSVTPSLNNELIIAGQANLNSNGGASSIDSGFTKTDGVDRAPNGLGVAIAYLIQTTATAANPTWSWPSAQSQALTIATFKAATAATGMLRRHPGMAGGMIEMDGRISG